MYLFRDLAHSHVDMFLSCGPFGENAGSGHGQADNSSRGSGSPLLRPVPRPRRRARGRAVRPEL